MYFTVEPGIRYGFAVISEHRWHWAQGGLPAASIGAVGTDTNLSCDGCPTTDTRTQVRHAALNLKP